MSPLTGSASWPAACEALYRAHAARLVRLGQLLLHDAQEAQEVVQEVFVRLLESAPSSDRSAEIREWSRWLTRVTVNACRDRRRAGWWRWWRRWAEDLAEVEVVDRGPTPEGAALENETRARIWRAFRRLPARQREVVVLRQLEGWSTEEVAQALQVSSGSVKRHLYRAVRRLRAELGGGL